MIEEQDERLQPLVNAADQFIAAHKDGNVVERMDYFVEIFEAALKGEGEQK